MGFVAEQHRLPCTELTPGHVRWPRFPQTYFQTMGTLTPLYYWIGIRRTNTSSPFAYLDGGVLPQLPSSSPYAHWNWYQPLAANHSLYNCAMAYNAYRWAGCWYHLVQHADRLPAANDCICHRMIPHGQLSPI